MRLPLSGGRPVSTRSGDDPGSLDDVVADAAVSTRLQEISPETFDAVSGFWRTPFAGKHLEPRMKELILLAMHASATTLNVEAVERHVARARREGASDADIVDVLA